MAKKEIVVTLPLVFTVEVDEALAGHALAVAVSEESSRFLGTVSPKRIRNADDFAFYPRSEVESLTINPVTVEVRS